MKNGVVAAGQHYLQACSRLAVLSAGLGEDRYPVTPKHHTLWRIIKMIEWEADMTGFAMNPVLETCAQDEDFVGRLARVCRAVSPRATALRTTQRCLLQCREVWFAEAEVPACMATKTS